AVGMDSPAQLGHLLQRPAVIGGTAADLLEHHGDPHASAPRGVQGILNRHVVVGNHRLDLDSVGPRQVCCHIKVHHVAGVVLDDVKHAGATVDGLRGRLHLVGSRGGEYRAGTSGVEHARAHEPAVHRFMPGAAAGYESNFSLHGGVGPDHDSGVVADPH